MLCRVLLHAVNLRHGTEGFTSPPKEVRARDFYHAETTWDYFGVFEERYKDTGRQFCKVLSRTISGMRQLRKCPRKPKSVGSVNDARLLHEHKVNASTNNFSLRKKRPRLSPMFCTTFGCYNFNQAWTREFYVLPGPLLESGRADVQQPGPDPWRPLTTGQKHN
jgi:hypothetical protein